MEVIQSDFPFKRPFFLRTTRRP